MENIIFQHLHVFFSNQCRESTHMFHKAIPLHKEYLGEG